VEEFVIGDLPAQGTVVDGRGEFVADEGRDFLAAVDAECGLADVGVEVAGPEGALRGSSFEQAFGEQGFEWFSEVEGEGVTAPVGVRVQEADGRMQRSAA